MRPLTVMIALTALTAVPVALGCYVVSRALPQLLAARMALLGD